MKLFALGIDQNAARRARLKSVAFGTQLFEKFIITPNTRHALGLLEDLPQLDILFIGDQDSSELPWFERELAERRSDLATYSRVLVCSPVTLNHCALSKNLLSGITAALIEPFSPETLEDLACLTLSLRNASTEQVQQGAVKNLVSAALKNLDDAANSKAHGHSGVQGRKGLSELRDMVATLSEENLTLYSEILMEGLLNANTANLTSPRENNNPPEDTLAEPAANKNDTPILVTIDRHGNVK